MVIEMYANSTFKARYIYKLKHAFDTELCEWTIRYSPSAAMDILGDVAFWTGGKQSILGRFNESGSTDF